MFLVAGDKEGNWDAWYDQSIPVAEERYRRHQAECMTQTQSAPQAPPGKVKRRR